MTIEDPIEVLHADRMAMVSQREVGTDTVDIVDALRRVARQGADVIFLSYLMDADAIAEALTVAAAGCLVIGVMDTLSVLDTIRWIIDRQPTRAGAHPSPARSGAAGVVCQRLVDRRWSGSRRPRRERHRHPQGARTRSRPAPMPRCSSG
ncbi:MAG: ATPase, T2SS/T4P/T4SS family [Acidimicrobiales bacterium]